MSLIFLSYTQHLLYTIPPTTLPCIPILSKCCSANRIRLALVRYVGPNAQLAAFLLHLFSDLSQRVWIAPVDEEAALYPAKMHLEYDQ
jgi:hypothetical protein